MHHHWSTTGTNHLINGVQLRATNSPTPNPGTMADLTTKLGWWPFLRVNDYFFGTYSLIVREWSIFLFWGINGNFLDWVITLAWVRPPFPLLGNARILSLSHATNKQMQQSNKQCNQCSQKKWQYIQHFEDTYRQCYTATTTPVFTVDNETIQSTSTLLQRGSCS